MPWQRLAVAGLGAGQRGESNKFSDDTTCGLIDGSPPGLCKYQ